MNRALKKPLASLVAFSLVLGLVPLRAMADELMAPTEEPPAQEQVLKEEPAPEKSAPAEETPAAQVDAAKPEPEPATMTPAAIDEPAPAEAAEPTSGEDALEKDAGQKKDVALKAKAPTLTAQATTIDGVPITVTPPKVGQKNVNAASLVSISAGAHCTLKSAYWVLSDSSSTIVTATTNIDGYPYALAITLTADKGYEFQNGSRYTVTGATPQDSGVLRLYDSNEATANVLVTPAEDVPATVDMRVWTPGHGKVLVNGSDYGTEFQGTWNEGTEVSVEAVPDAGYKFARWWIASKSGSGRLVKTASTTMTAGTDTEAEARFGLEVAPITITAPEPGTSGADNLPAVTVPSGAGYSVTETIWVGENSTLDALSLVTPNFEAGKTYYAYVIVEDSEDEFASAGGGAAFNTNLDVSGGNVKARRNWQTSDGVKIEAIIAVTIPEPETHTVTFDTQGGTPVAAQTVNDGEYATKPANPKKDGFYFLGWYEKPGAQLTREEVHANKPVGFDFAKTAITEDKTLYAVWYEGFYGATYDLSAKTPKYAETGGNATFTSTYQQMSPHSGKVWWDYSIIEGSKVTVTAIPAAGARFVGWAPGTLDSNGNMPNDPSSLGNIVSTENPYTFTFDGKTALAALFEPEAPKYELSFAFTNLYPGAQPQTLVESLTVNGEDWTPTSGNITAKDIPAGSSVTATVKVTDNASLATYNNPKDTISDLVPTYSDDGSKLTFTFTMPETDARVVVYLFEAVTVTYDANGGTKTDAWVDFVKWMKYTASTPATINVSQELYDLYSDELRVQPPAGSTFAGIEVTQNKTGAKVKGKPGETITADFSEGGIIKFLWAKDVTVTFDAKGGTPVPAAQTFEAGGKATEPTAPTKEGGWTLAGWYTDEALTEPFSFDTAVNNDTTLYARWNGTIDVETYDETKGESTTGGTFTCESIVERVEGMYSYGSGSIAEGSTVKLTATPAEGNRFVGWAKDTADGAIVSTDAAYSFAFEKTPTTLFAVFEEIPPTLTLHWTSVDGDDLVDPIPIEASTGMNVAQALNLYDGSSMTTDVFANAKEGYVWSGYQTPKPISAYKSIDDLNAARVEGTDSIGKGLDIYYVMFKEIDAVEMSVEAPACGTETAMVSGKQTNPPAVTLGEGNYGPAFEGQPVAMWGEWETDHAVPFEGKLVGDTSYPLLALLAADFGYCFADNASATVNGATDAKTLASPDSPLLVLGVAAQVTAEHVPGETVTENVVEPSCTEAGSHDEAVYCSACEAEISRKTVTDPALGHDWSAWEVVKEATETEDGLEQRTCKRCEEVEERVIPAIGVEYRVVSGDGSVYTKGSGTDLTFVFKRNINDETTFEHFTGILVDGVAVAADQYTAKSGSVEVTLKASYLETLSEGKHSLTAQFEDGNDPVASFTVKAESKKDETKKATTKKQAESKGKNLPQTGDPFSAALFGGLLVGGSFSLGMGARRRRRQ